MKNIYTFLFLLSCTFLNAQIVNIPDANFKNALIDEGVDTNNDGEIQVSEAEVVLNLNVSFKDILSMREYKVSLILKFCIAPITN